MLVKTFFAKRQLPFCVVGLTVCLGMWTVYAWTSMDKPMQTNIKMTTVQSVNNQELLYLHVWQMYEL